MRRRGVAKIAAPGLELRSGLISRILSRRHAREHSAARPAPMPWLVHEASARTGARLSKRKFQRITINGRMKHGADHAT